jgi:F-type H+-transporting ATPase subunit a
MRRFGIAGFFLNQVPSMSLPLVMAVFIKPLLLVLELVGYCIKHAVLALRLLANMVAGHMVLLGILGLAFGASGALLFDGQPTWLWGGTAVVSVVASALFSCLELFVAFLQAYIFTFLSALFIGAAIHHH